MRIWGSVCVCVGGGVIEEIRLQRNEEKGRLMVKRRVEEIEKERKGRERKKERGKGKEREEKRGRERKTERGGKRETVREMEGEK